MLVTLGLFTAQPAGAATSGNTPAPPAKVSVRPTGPVAMDLGVAVGRVVFVPDAAPAVQNNIHYTWGWVTGTGYLNKSESRFLRGYSYALLVAAGMCAAFGWETAGYACVASGVMLSQWQWVASEAATHGTCVKIKVPTMIASEYRGGYCT